MITMNTKKTYMILHEKKENLEWMNSEDTNKKRENTRKYQTEIIELKNMN